MYDYKQVSVACMLERLSQNVDFMRVQGGSVPGFARAIFKNMYKL